MAEPSRNPQVSFRVTPDVHQVLTHHAAGQSLYAFMPGFVDDALAALFSTPAADPATPDSQLVENLRHELAQQAQQADQWKAEYESLKDTLATERDQAGETRRLAGNSQRESQQLGQQLSQLQADHADLQARLGRVINHAVKNSCVTRKRFESL